MEKELGHLKQTYWKCIGTNTKIWTSSIFLILINVVRKKIMKLSSDYLFPNCLLWFHRWSSSTKVWSYQDLQLYPGLSWFKLLNLSRNCIQKISEVVCIPWCIILASLIRYSLFFKDTYLCLWKIQDKHGNFKNTDHTKEEVLKKNIWFLFPSISNNFSTQLYQ